MAKRGSGSGRFDRPQTESEILSFSASLKDADGELIVTINDDQLREPQVIDITYWLRAGPISSFIGTGLLRQATSTRRAQTRRSFTMQLRDGLFAYCKDRPDFGQISLHTLTSAEFVRSFVRWLNQQKNKHGKPLKVGTKRHNISAVRTLLKWLKPDLDSQGIECTVPKNPWPGRHDSEAAEPLSEGDFIKVIDIAASASIRLISEISPLLDEFLSKEREASPIESDPQTRVECLRLLMDRCGGQLPDRQDLPPDLRASADQFGYTSIRQIIYPQSSDLIPLYLMLMLYTGFNQQPLSELELGEVRRVHLLGAKRTLLRPLKDRAKKVQRRSFVDGPEVLAPNRILDFLGRWTSVLRRSAPGRIATHVFIYAHKFKNDQNWVRSFGETSNGRANVVPQALWLLLKEAIPNYVGGRKLRATFAHDALDILNGDLETAGVLLGHTSFSITSGSYRAQAAKKSDELRLAGGMIARDRLVSSSGQVDIRPLPQRDDRSAATPGFVCADLFNSPIAGQEKGKACDAYGQCPRCPLHGLSALPRHELLARFLQLRERMEEARDKFGAVIWKQRLGAAFDALTKQIIPLVADQESLIQARRISLSSLPPFR